MYVCLLDCRFDCVFRCLTLTSASGLVTSCVYSDECIPCDYGLHVCSFSMCVSLVIQYSSISVTLGNNMLYAF